MLFGNKKRRKKKFATLLWPVIIMLVGSRFIFICNNPPPPSTTPALFRRTSITHVELFPKFGPQNKFFDNHEYSRRSLKLLLFLDSGVWRNLWSVSFLSGRRQRRCINVTGFLNHWPCIFWPLLCRIKIYGVYGKPLLQWSTTEPKGLIEKFPCTKCTGRSIQRKISTLILAKSTCFKRQLSKH